MLFLYLHIFLSSLFTGTPADTNIKHECSSVIEACNDSRHVEAIEVAVQQLGITSVNKEKSPRTGVADTITSNSPYSNYTPDSFTGIPLVQSVDDIVLRFRNLRL